MSQIPHPNHKNNLTNTCFVFFLCTSSSSQSSINHYLHSSTSSFLSQIFLQIQHKQLFVRSRFQTHGSSTRRAPIPNHPRSSERNNFNPKTISKDFLPHPPHPCLPSLHFLPGFLFISHKPKLHFLKKKQKKRKSMKTHIPFCTLVTAFLKNPVTESLED